MMKKYCRICQTELPEPLLTLEQVPRAAQNLPRQEDLAADRGTTLHLRQCPRCGVIQHDGEVVPYYREVLRAAGISPAMAAFRRSQFAKWVKDYGLTGKKVLEVGCGRGEYLSLMSEMPVQAFGLEYGETAVAEARKKGLSVQRGFPEAGCPPWEDGPFDAFFVLNFLEHIPEIPDWFSSLRKNLSPGAAGLVEVPNFDMILKRNLVIEFSTEHIFNFTQETLRTTLESNGFQVLSMRNVWSDYILSAEVRLRPVCSLAGCTAVVNQLKKQIGDFHRKYGPFALWGVGHQALTLLALAELTAEEIPFAVDSSPEKQGRFTYVTHIPIVSPEELENTSVQAVVAACGGYTDEVIGLLKSRFGNRFHLAALREDGLEEL